MPDLCEIRVPTYRRPQLLGRALQSLVDQTHRHWTCIVLDDSPDGEGEPIVKELGDRRVLYRRNAGRMGAEGNIDQAFGKSPFDAGAAWFCVLEDDNYLLPTFLAENIHTARATSAKVLLRNQLVETVHDEGFSPLSRRVLDDRYAEGTYPPEVVWAESIFNIGLSNGGIFWSVDCKSDFEIAIKGVSAVLQEYCRALRLEDEIHVCLEPLAVWRGIEEESLRSSFNRHAWRREARVLQFIRQCAYDRLQAIDRQAIMLDDSIYRTPLAQREAGVRRLRRAWPGNPSTLALRRRASLYLKSLALSICVRVPPDIEPGLHRGPWQRPPEDGQAAD